MASIQKFEDLEVWQKSRLLCKAIFPLTNSGDFERDLKLRDQIKGASGSIMDNIAEGFERNGRGEFRQFLSIAKGSSGEVRSQLYRALDREYVSPDQFNELKDQAEEISKQLNNFIK